MTIKTPFSVDYISDVETYVITFTNSGNTAQLQFETCNQINSGNHGLDYLVRYTDFDDCLSESEVDLMDSLTVGWDLMNYDTAERVRAATFDEVCDSLNSSDEGAFSAEDVTCYCETSGGRDFFVDKP